MQDSGISIATAMLHYAIDTIAYDLTWYHSAATKKVGLRSNGYMDILSLAFLKVIIMTDSEEKFIAIRRQTPGVANRSGVILTSQVNQVWVVSQAQFQ